LKDRWILKRINDVTRDVTESLDEFEIGMAAQKIYDFFWSEFCDWYIEMAKIDLYGGDEEAKQRTRAVLWTTLERALKLLHPFMPFITEEIWQNIPHRGKSIMVSDWPKFNPDWDFEDAKDMEIIMDAVRGIRNIRAEMNVPPAKKARVFARVGDPGVLNILKENVNVIYSLAKVENMEFLPQDAPAPHKAVTCVIKGAEIFVPMEGLVDIETEIARLKKEQDNLKKEIERVEKKLGNQGFLAKAPADVVDKERQKQRDYRDMLQKVEQRLRMMSELR
jgi:valyl-tRNA synthetase